MKRITEKVNSIFSLFTEFGSSDYIGENVSQLSHAVQAAMLARQEGYNNEVILAALFHDIGHLVALSQGEYKSMNGFGAESHENIGIEYLQSLGFSGNMLLLIQAHVAAKRYLVSKHENYYNLLSEASKQTLKYQGGKMNADEILHFEQHPLFPLFIKMREWDDKAKVENYAIGNLEGYKQMCVSYLMGQ
jgi:putative nucleotidyltransferase with HDIG domain